MWGKTVFPTSEIKSAFCTFLANASMNIVMFDFKYSYLKPLQDQTVQIPLYACQTLLSIATARRGLQPKLVYTVILVLYIMYS